MVGELSKSLFASLIARGDHAVAVRGDEVVTASELLGMAGALAAELPEATPGSEVAFSFDTDILGCAAALLATWARGHTACLPQDGARENIMPLLAREQNVAFLHDTGVGLGTFVPRLLAETAHREAPEWEARDEDRVALTAFLHSPMSEESSASWTEAELLLELDRRVQELGLSEESQVASCFSPTAIPGLLLGLLAPLRTAATFAAKTINPSEPLEASGLTMIASPTHARILGDRADEQLGQLKELVCVDEALDSISLRKLTESGLNIVEAAELPLDVQVLPFTETLRLALFEQSEVRDVAIALLPDSSGNQHQALIEIVAPESSEPALRSTIEKQLDGRGSYQLKLMPGLPRDANGRLPDWKVFLEFRYGRNGQPMEPALTWSEVETSEPDQRRFRTRLPENYAFFEGHYTTYPVLAGAAQLHELAQACIKLVDPGATAVRRLSAVKFLSRIAPCDKVDVVISTSDRERDFQFEILCGDRRCSMGRIEYFEEAK